MPTGAPSPASLLSALVAEQRGATGAARLLGVAPQSVRRWVRQRAVPRAVAVVLLVWAGHAAAAGELVAGWAREAGPRRPGRPARAPAVGTADPTP